MTIWDSIEWMSSASGTYILEKKYDKWCFAILLRDVASTKHYIQYIRELLTNSEIQAWAIIDMDRHIVLAIAEQSA